MAKHLPFLGLAAGVLLVGASLLVPPAPPADPVCPGPNCPNNPTPPVLPAPLPPTPPEPAPKPKPKPWGPREGGAVAPHCDGCPCGPDCHCSPCRCSGHSLIGEIKTGGSTAPDGKTQVQVDLPTDQRAKNVGGRDGAGLCVFTSIMHSARWQNEARLFEFQKQMTAEPGGGDPGKVDRMIAKYGQGTDYVQYKGSDPTILKAALKGGRLPGVTYNGRDGVHYRGSIAHMVNLAYLDDTIACVLDNNFIGENELVWMTAQEFLDRWKGGGGGWAVILCNPPPPPPPSGIQSASESFAAANPYRDLPQAGNYEWRNCPDSSYEHFLYLNSVKFGYWRSDKDQYFPYDAKANRWGSPCVPPVATPRPAVFRNFGVSTEKLSPLEGYSANGKVVTRDQALALVTGPEKKCKDFPNDTDRLRVTVIGPKAETDKVRADWEASPLLAHARDLCVFQAYDPSAPHEGWALRCGFLHDGQPVTVYVQLPSGRVRSHTKGYPGAALLAEAVRKADPNYHSDKDPDLTKPSPLSIPSLDAPLALGLGRDQLVLAGLACLILGGVSLLPSLRKP